MPPSPQSDTTEDLRETPTWRFPSQKNEDSALPKISATFIFATRLEGGEQLPDHIKLNELTKTLREDPRVWRALIEPTESYFGDIVRSGPGRAGRPLVFLCEGKCEPDERIVIMHRPAVTEYQAEGRRIRLTLSDAKRARIRWSLRDAFALFESRHLLYLLSLVSIGEQLDRIDEYALIQLQKLFDPSYETDLRNDLRFSNGLSSPDTLCNLVAARLDELGARNKAEPNGVHVLRDHVLKEFWKLPPFGWAQLRSLVFAVEDDEKGGQIWRTFATRERLLESDSDDRKDWQKKQKPVTGVRGLNAHLNPKCPRPKLYALSGFLRGVFDFPLQDTSELEDALDPVYEKDDWAVFSNRQSLIEIGTSEWRSLRDARTSLGTCPYVALVQCMALYHELLLSDVEKQIDALLYCDQKEAHVKAMQDLSSMLEYARSFFSSGRFVERELRRRINIVRDLLIFRPVNIFSYGMERDLFETLIAHHNVEARSEAVMDLIDRYEGLVEDGHQFITTTAERRLTLLVLFVTAIGLLTVYEPIEALLGFQSYDLTKWGLDQDRWVIVGVAFAFLLLAYIWLRRR